FDSRVQFEFDFKPEPRILQLLPGRHNAHIGRQGHAYIRLPVSIYCSVEINAQRRNSDVVGFVLDTLLIKPREQESSHKRTLGRATIDDGTRRSVAADTIGGQIDDAVTDGFLELLK